jgi:hypothetical protein
LRARVWALCAYAPQRVTVNIDTTVATVYGTIEGARKGHNAKHRGKQALRPVLCFLEETREYLCGTQRRGETIRNEEVARQIRQFRKQLPESVREVHVRGDGEFIGWESVHACLEEGFRFTFGNKRCDPPFPEARWSRHGTYEYNECGYQPMGWEQPCRFVVMRMRKDQMGDRQLRACQVFCVTDSVVRLSALDLLTRRQTDSGHASIPEWAPSTFWQFAACRGTGLSQSIHREERRLGFSALFARNN